MRLTLLHNDCETVFFSFDLIVAASAAALVDTKGATHTDKKVNWVNLNILKNQNGGQIHVN